MVWRRLLLIVFCSVSVLAFAAGRQELKCYIVPKEAHLHPLGPMNPYAILHLAIGIPGRNQAELDQLVQNINDPKSPEYRHYLSPGEYGKRFGADQANYDAVAAYFKNKGFKITTFPNHTLLDIDGTVKMIEEVFHTTLRLYKHPNENRNFFAPGPIPSIDLDIPLSYIAGLDNFIKFHPAH